MFKPKGAGPASASDSDAKPPSSWDKLLTTTPVVMTVVATLLAGLSSSEMTKAQYYRSLAAQSQSKVGDQWAFFQAKRARASNHALTIKLLRAVTDARELDPAALQVSVDQVATQLRIGEKKTQELLGQIGPSAAGAAALRSAA